MSTCASQRRPPTLLQALMWQDDLIGVAVLVMACLNGMNPPVLGGQHLISLVWLEEMWHDQI